MKIFKMSMLALSVVLATSTVYAKSANYKDYKAELPQTFWMGPYVGFTAGYGWGNYGVDQDDSSFFSPFDPQAIPVAVPTLADKPDGAIGGLLVGYNMPWYPAVFGAEIDWQWTSIKDSETLPTGNMFLLPITTHADQQIDQFGTIRLRFGITAIPSLLIYATGGLAYGYVSLSSNARDSVNCTVMCSREKREKFQDGWIAGAGAEYAVTSTISAKLEYAHYDLGTTTLRLPSEFTPRIHIDQEVDFIGNIIRFGVNMKLTGLF